MAEQSKLWWDRVDYTCYEIGHTWSPHCWLAIYQFAANVTKQSFKLNLAFYLANFILRRQKVTTGNLKKLVVNVLQSTSFLGVTGFFHLFSTCALRHTLGGFYMVTAAMIPGFIASFIGILIERENRRSSLALYVANVASETLFRMLVSRQIIRAVPNGEVFIFCCMMALYMLQLKKAKHDDVLSKLLKFILQGSHAPIKQDTGFCHANGSHKQQRTENSLLTGFTHWLTNHWKSLLLQFQQLPKHISCPHPHSCFYTCVSISARSFVLGYAVKAAVMTLPHLNEYVKNPKMVLKLFNRTHMNLGLFLGSFTGIYNLISCLLRWHSNKEENWHSVPAGFLAGTSMFFFKSSTLALYIVWKVIEVYYQAGMEAEYLPCIPGAILILYASSCALLFHASVVEPHNLKPAYYKFLQRITCGLIDKVNRVLMNEIIVGSSVMFPNYLPKLDKRYMTEEAINYMSRRFPGF